MVAPHHRAVLPGVFILRDGIDEHSSGTFIRTSAAYLDYPPVLSTRRTKRVGRRLAWSDRKDIVVVIGHI